MIKYLYFRKKNNVLSMVSDKPFKTFDETKLIERKTSLVPSKLQEIKDGYISIWKNGKLKTVKNKKNNRLTNLEKYG